MRTKNNIKTKGATNVRPKVHSAKKIFESKDAEVIRDERKWDAFQLVGDTNAEEINHISKLNRRMSEKELQKILDRGLAFRMGRKIRMILDTETV